MDAEGFEGGLEFSGTVLAEGMAPVGVSGVGCFEVAQGGVDHFAHFAAGHGEQVDGGTGGGEGADGGAGG